MLSADTTNEIDVLGVELDTLTSQLLSEQGRLDEHPGPSSIRVGEVLHPAQQPTEPANRGPGKIGLVAAFLGLTRHRVGLGEGTPRQADHESTISKQPQVLRWPP